MPLIAANRGLGEERSSRAISWLCEAQLRMSGALIPLEYMKICSSTEITIIALASTRTRTLGWSKRRGYCLTHLQYHLSIEGVDRCTVELEPSDASVDA